MIPPKKLKSENLALIYKASRSKYILFLTNETLSWGSAGRGRWWKLYAAEPAGGTNPKAVAAAKIQPKVVAAAVIAHINI